MTISFFDGMNTFQLLNEKSKAKLKTVPQNIKNGIAVLETAASHSSWNFRNKVIQSVVVWCSGLVFIDT